MLCPEHHDICTNRCEKLQTCNRRNSPSHRKIPFLVETLDRFVSKITPETIEGIPVIRYKQYAIAPQATENGVLNKLSPTCDKPSLYSDYANGAA